jgi:hypothetical protein
MTISTDLRERQRFEHLVLGRKRPPATIPEKPAGVSRQEWKIQKKRLRDAGQALVAGIEERVSLRERWSHKANGTPETHEHADRAARRPGSLARLHASGAIDDDQLAAADGIADAYRMVTAGVAIRTASLVARVDGGGHGKAEAAMFAGIHADFTYDLWRRTIGAGAAPVLDVIVHDQGLTLVARHYGMSMPRARRMLARALDHWWTARGEARPSARAAAAAGHA